MCHHVMTDYSDFEIDVDFTELKMMRMLELVFSFRPRVTNSPSLIGKVCGFLTAVFK